MNTNFTLSRRSLIHGAAVTGIAVLGASTFPGVRSAFAQAGTSGTHFVCQYNDVNLRDNYGLASNVIGVLNTGDAVTLTGDSVGADGHTWIPITVDATGESGWAAFEFFGNDGGGNGWPAGTAVHVSSDNVNLRSGPGLGYDVIGNYSTGTNATITAGPEQADGYEWYELQIDGTAGWMDAEFLAEGAGGGGDSGWPAGTEVHITSDNVNLRTEPGLGSRVILTMAYGSNWIIVDGPVDADGYSWYQIKVPEGAGLGWAAADFLAEGPGDGGGGWASGTTVMTTSSLNLRSEPGTGYGIIATYGGNERATIVDGPSSADGYSWYQVEILSDGNVGWFAGEFLEIAATEPTGDRLRVVDGPLNLRAEPGTGSGVIEGLETGTIVVIVDSSFVQADGYLWMNVYVESDPESIGWIAQGFTEAA